MDKENTSVYVHEENITVSFEVTDDKPFNKCFECNSLRNGCSGPNLGVMGVARACEYLQLARIFLGIHIRKLQMGQNQSFRWQL